MEYFSVIRKRNKIITLVLAIFLILFCIGSAGCLVQNKPEQPLTTIPVTNTANISPVPPPDAPTPIQTISVSSWQSGVGIFKNAESICVGESLSFGLINEGHSTIYFGVGDPYWIQFYNNGTWGEIFLGGGTQASWELTPGKKIDRQFEFVPGNWLGEYYNGTGWKEFTVRPGMYRIIFQGENNVTKEPFRLATEFTIKDCQSGIPGK
jgi:hypothetical protein